MGPARTSALCCSLVVLALTGCVHAAPVPREAAEPRPEPASSTQAPSSATPSTGPTLLPLTELPSLDLEARFGGYIARDAAWSAGQPLAINRDFDFGVAMSMQDIGPGLAAKRRRDGNEELANQLAGLAPLDPGALLQMLCDAPPRTTCQQLAAQSVRLYGLLWGDKDARLLVVLEVVEPAPRFSVHATISDARPLAAFLEPNALGSAFHDGLAALATVIDKTAPPTATTGACELSPGAKLAGRVIANEAAFTLLTLDTPSAPRVLCPSDATETTPPAPPQTE